MDTETIRSWLASIAGMPCWRVCAGGSAGSSISLDLGGKVPRPEPVNPGKWQALVTKYKLPNYRDDGEAGILIWCTWRLNGPSQAIASSDEDPSRIAGSLSILEGRQVVSIELYPPAWDMRIAFSGDLELAVFCDHIPGDPSYHVNWEAHIHSTWLSAGPGYNIAFRDETGK